MTVGSYAGLNKLDAQGTAHRTSGPAQGIQRHGLNGGVEQPVKLAAAGVHPLRRSSLGQPAFFHCGGELVGDDFFDCVVFTGLQQALFGEEIAKRLFAHTAFFVLYHLITSRLRFKANSISAWGVFCVFLMKPCSKIM